MISEQTSQGKYITHLFQPNAHWSRASILHTCSSQFRNVAIDWDGLWGSAQGQALEPGGHSAIYVAQQRDLQLNVGSEPQSPKVPELQTRLALLRTGDRTTADESDSNSGLRYYQSSNRNVPSTSGFTIMRNVSRSHFLPPDHSVGGLGRLKHRLWRVIDHQLKKEQSLTTHEIKYKNAKVLGGEYL